MNNIEQQNPGSPLEIDYLSQQVHLGDFSGISKFIAETMPRCDWDDRYFVVAKVSQAVHPDALKSACASAPSDAGLHLLLGAHYYNTAMESRGRRQVEETTEEQFEAAIKYAQACYSCLSHAASLEPNDPTPHAFIIRAMMLSTQFLDKQEASYQAGDRLAPHFVALQFIEVNAKSLKWGGSHEECLDTARAALKKGKPGDDMPSCLFLAHFLVWQYSWAFAKDAPRAAAYLADPQVNAELDSVFDRWTDTTYRPRRSSPKHLHHAAIWYFKTGDGFRLRRCLELTNNQPHEETWAQLGGAQKKFAEALQMSYDPAQQTPVALRQKNKGLFGLLLGQLSKKGPR